jgi:hypothetical protein
MYWLIHELVVLETHLGMAAVDYFIVLLPFFLSCVLGSSLLDIGVAGWLTFRVGFGCSSNSNSFASSVLRSGSSISFCGS